MKRIKWLASMLVVLLLMAMPVSVFAVPLPFVDESIDFVKRFGGSEDDVFTDIRPTGDDFILAGYANSQTTSFAAPTASVYGGGVIMKVGPTGSVLWGKVYEDLTEPLQLHVFSAVEPVTGGYIAVGMTYKASYGDYYALAVKFDNNGNVLWRKTFGVSGNNQFLDICPAGDGNVVVGGIGYRYPRADYGGTRNGLVMKLDAGTGEMIWQTAIGGTVDSTDMTTLNAIAQTGDGGFVVCGSTRNNDGDFSGPVLNDTQAFVIKLNAAGVRQWTSTMGGSDSDGFFSIAPLATGKLMAVGGTASIDGDFPCGTSGGTDAVVAVLSETGSLIRHFRLSGNSTDSFRKVVPTADGAIVFGGTESTGGDFTGKSNGYVDGMAAKVTETGGFSWITMFGGTGADQYNSGLGLGAGKYLAVGKTKSDNGDLTGTSIQGREDLLLTAFTIAPEGSDTTGPSLELAKDPTGATNGNVTITATATDASGVKQITLPDNTVAAGASAAFTATANGDYTFKAEDTKGNITTKTITISTIDRVAPVITIQPYEATAPVDADITVTATVNEGSLNAASHTFTENGSFEFVATDAAGNIAKKTVTITNIAKTAPRIISVTGTQKTLASGRIELTVNILTAKYPAGTQVSFQLLDADKRPLASPITGVALVGEDGKAQLVIILPDGFAPGAYVLSAGIGGQSASSKDSAIVILPADIPQTGEAGNGGPWTLVQTLALVLIAAALALALVEKSRRRRS